MKYIVVNPFYDKEDKNTYYQVGDEYPKGDFKPTVERVEELSTEHPKHKKSFIEEVETDEEKAAREAEEKAKADETEKVAIRNELESLGVSVHPNTGLEKLREKLEEVKVAEESKE